MYYIFFVFSLFYHHTHLIYRYIPKTVEGFGSVLHYKGNWDQSNQITNHTGVNGQTERQHFLSTLQKFHSQQDTIGMWLKEIGKLTWSDHWKGKTWDLNLETLTLNMKISNEWIIIYIFSIYLSLTAGMNARLWLLLAPSTRKCSPKIKIVS